MDNLELFSIVALFSPVKALFKSMAQSKTLTIMVLIGITFFVGFGIFLFKMAGMN